MNNAIAFIPDSWTTGILIAKGIFAIIGVLLLIWHMNREWCCMRHPDQRARYMLLLAYGVLATGSTAEQLQEGIELSYRHLGSLVCAVGLTVVATWSIVNYERRGGRSVHNHTNVVSDDRS